ncbi:hypothetical protein L0128_17115 [candidate division KSB1 bacterium]|nr:hypothetical protein [candidate division KSB1 bacterium]
MADINLLGNDRGSSEKAGRREEGYSDTADYNQNPYPNSSLGGLPESGFDPKDSYIDQGYMKKGQKGLMYVLIAACVVLFALLIILLFSDDKKEPTEVAKVTESEKIKTPAEVTQQPLATGPNTETLSNVEALLNAFPQSLRLSMIRYSQGEFILESQAQSEPPLDELGARVRQVLPRAQIKESSKSKSSVSGRRVGLLSGLVPDNSIWTRPDQIGQLSYVGESELKRRIDNYCGQENLKVREYNVGRTKTENNYRKIMIRLRVVGKRENAMRLLKALNDEKINVNYSKIVLDASEPLLQADMVNLKLDLELFSKIM